MAGRSVEIQLTAQQREFISYLLYDDEIDQIGYGGSRGGNKTFSGALGMVLRRLMYPGTRGLALRKTMRATVGNLIDEFRKVMGKDFLDISYRYLKNEGVILLPNGSSIHLGHCANEQSYEIHIGMQYTDIWWEEAVQHTPQAISLVNASCRTDFGRGITPKMWYTTNPGGPGHQYLLEAFVDEETRKPGHIWIKSTLRDALPTLVNDPGYLDRITKGLSAWKRKQWVDGDWKAMAGQYFSIDPAQTLIEVDVQSIYWADWVAGVDYGASAPFAVVIAVQWRDINGKDRIHFVKEIYQRGLHLDEQAQLALSMEREIQREFGRTPEIMYWGDPAILAPKPTESQDQDRTVAQAWAKYGWCVVASNKAARVPNWHLMRMLMKDGVMTISPSGCPAMIKEIQNAVYENPDSSTSEDISKRCDDHALDATSYVIRKAFMGGYSTGPGDPYKQTERGLMID